MHAKLGLVPVALVFCLVGPSPAQNMDELMRINAIVLEAPIPEEGLPATVVGFQVASESRSTYKLTDDGWKIATREYTTLFVDPE